MNGKLLKCEVKISFSGLTEEQKQHLYKAEEELRLAGISFDTGGFVDCNGTRDWEFGHELSPTVTVWLKPSDQGN